MSEVATRSAISLRGSAQLVSEYFNFGLSSILYQRGIYPSSYFERTQKYGTSIQALADKKLKDFVSPLLDQVKVWLESGELRRLVLVIAEVQTKEVLERWQFDVEADENLATNGQSATSSKSEAKIRKEIGDVIRQITASVTFLPLIEHACSFDVLIYTGKETSEPWGWAESGPRLIANSAFVDLRAFSTGLHNVGTKVTYRNEDPLE